MDSTQARKQFTATIAAPEDQIDLASAALWIAAESYPDLDVPGELDRLDALAERARGPVEGAENHRERVEALIRVLFEDEGFRGNREDYYDPRNSFLNEVLERRTGIPISLALVFIEVARRLGMNARGISFPGHFLVKVLCDGPGGEIVVDCFLGKILTRDDCEERLRAALGENAVLHPSLLAAAPQREILTRMLANLKMIHIDRSDFESALACSERCLLLQPDAPLELRDRGLIFQRLECFQAAVADFESFLRLAPGHESSGAIRRALAGLRERARQLH